MRWGWGAPHTHSIYSHPPPLLFGGSRSLVICWIGQESRLCVFTWNLSCGTSIAPSLSLSLYFFFPLSLSCLLSLCLSLFALSLHISAHYIFTRAAGSSIVIFRHDIRHKKNPHLLWVPLLHYCTRLVCEDESLSSLCLYISLVWYWLRALLFVITFYDMDSRDVFLIHRLWS